jgi:hypothetical protein
MEYLLFHLPINAFINFLAKREKEELAACQG